MANEITELLESITPEQFSRWIPHRHGTWTHRYARLKQPVLMRHFRGHHLDQQFAEVPCEIGRQVKIVMVSRFGDVGITEDLAAETGYGARVDLDGLTQFSINPQPTPKP